MLAAGDVGLDPCLSRLRPPAELLGAKFMAWQLQQHLEELQAYVDPKGLVAIMAAITLPALVGQQGGQQAGAASPAAAAPPRRVQRRIIPVTMAAAGAEPLLVMGEPLVM